MTLPRRIVCIGGWGSTNDAWTDLARALPGCRLEPVPWWECLDDGSPVLASRLASGPRPALLLGWSLGGLAALRASLDGLSGDVPLCLLAATARMCAEGDYPGADPRALRAMRMRLPRDPHGVLADFARACSAPSAPDGFPERFAARARAVPPSRLAAGLAHLADADLLDRLPGLRVPALWLHGEQDAVIPADSARHAASRAPAIDLELLPGAGHALPYAEAPAVAARIARMLA